MTPATDFSKQKIFLRQLVIASKKIGERDRANREIEGHIEKIKSISSGKKEVSNELEKLKSKIRGVVDKEKVTSKISSSGLFKEKIEEIEKGLDEHYKKTKSSRKKVLRGHIETLEENYKKLKKKYSKKDLKNIKDKINLLKKKL